MTLRREYGGLGVIVLLLLGAWLLGFRPIPVKVTEKPELTSDGRLVYEFQRPLVLQRDRAYLIQFPSPCGMTTFVPRNHEMITARGAECHFEERLGGGIVSTNTPQLVESPPLSGITNPGNRSRASGEQ